MASYPREVVLPAAAAIARGRCRETPVARLRHPMLPDMRLLSCACSTWSIGGCALLLPDDVPPLPVGAQINGVQIESTW